MKGLGFMDGTGRTRTLCLAVALLGVVAGSVVDSPAASDLIAGGDSFEVPHGPLQLVARGGRCASGDLVAARRPRLAGGPIVRCMPFGLDESALISVARDVASVSGAPVDDTASRAPPTR